MKRCHFLWFQWHMQSAKLVSIKEQLGENRTIMYTPSSTALGKHQHELQTRRRRSPLQFACCGQILSGCLSNTEKTIWNPIPSLCPALIWSMSSPSILGLQSQAASLRAWKPTQLAQFSREKTAAHAALQAITVPIAPSTRA